MWISGNNEAEASDSSPAILSLAPAASGAPALQPLRPGVGQAIALELNVEGRHSFQAANIGQLVVRSGDLLESVEIPERSGAAPLYTFKHPGPAVIMMTAAAEPSAASDAWQQVTHCTRVIVEVESDGPGLPAKYHDPGVNQKAGMRIELLPLLQTFRMHVGDLLPVKSYWKGRSAGGVTITAQRPDGSQVSATTKAWGVADFVMDQAGVWTMRYTKVHDGIEHVAELIFEISKETPR